MLRINVSNYYFNSSTVHYILSFSNDHKSFQTKYRYSELKQLDSRLAKLKLSLPNFPSRSLFGKTNENVAKIQERQDKLNQYFEQLCEITEIINSDIMQQFYNHAQLNTMN